MNYTFHRVAAFCSLRLSYYSTIALLALSFLCLALTEYRTASPLYILLTLAVMPGLLKAMFFSGPKKETEEKPLAFPLFCKKYQYNLTSYKSMNLAYLLLFVLLAAWQISYSLVEDFPGIVTGLPALISVISLLIRILAFVGYHLYFRLFPLKAMR